MILTTTERIDGKISKPIKIISGKSVRTRGWFGKLHAYVENLVGGKGNAYLSELKKTEDAAFKEMEDQAVLLGADAVVAIDIDITEVLNGFIMCSVNGTAVKFV
jgi:uncharacterized protein YbjQ (UPF0145 family)